MTPPNNGQTLNLHKVAITAVVNVDGSLSKVGEFREKYKAAIEEVVKFGSIGVIVVADDQNDVPAEWLDERESPLLVLKARTVSEAIQKLHEFSQPRAVIREYEREKCQTLELLDRTVPMATHYQLLPLLREVKREKLLHDPKEKEDNEDNDVSREEKIAKSERMSKSQKVTEDSTLGESEGLHSAHIVRWEESLREMNVIYDRIEDLSKVFLDFRATVNDLSLSITDVPRFIVIGPPGSGKTTLVQYWAWQAASRMTPFDQRDLLPVRVRLRDWQRWAVKEVNYSLPAFLVHHYARIAGKHKPTAMQWEQWLQRGGLLLLLDGLDELPDAQSFADPIKDALTAGENCPVVLTCRTVSYEQHKAVCPNFPVFTLDGLDHNTRTRFIHLYPVAENEEFDAEGVIKQLGQTPSMQPIASNPLLLAIICFVTTSGVKLPAKRSELYDKAVDKMLLQRRRGTTPPNEIAQKMPLSRKRQTLERAALQLFADNSRRRELTFDESSLLAALEQKVNEEVADALLEEFAQNSGLIRGDAEQKYFPPKEGAKSKYFFIHPTIHEFLTASALANIVNEKNWDAKITIEKKRVSIRHFVERKAWAIEWEEVIALFAGLLDNPEPLLEWLADEQQDDYFRHRLALAARCIGEIKAVTTKQMGVIVDRITTRVFFHWRKHHDIEKTVSHLRRALSALWECNGKMEKKNIARVCF